MPTIPFNYASFTGGMNTRDSFDLLEDSQSRDLQNVQALPSGAIVKRPGLATFATPASAPLSLFGCEATTGMFLIANVGSTLISISTAGVIANITGATTPTAGSRWEWITAPAVSGQGPLFGMNGVDTPQQWTGTGVMHDWTNTQGAVGVPNGKYCVQWQNQVFVAGVAGNPSRLYWSGISNPCDWDPLPHLIGGVSALSGAGFADFDIQDGDPITAIGVVGPYLMIAKPRKMWMMVTPGVPGISSSGTTAETVIRQMPAGIGCISHRSVASGPAGTYFLSEDRGVYLTNGSKLSPMSDIIKPTVDQIQNPGIAAGVVIDQHYYLSVAISGATNDTVLDFDETLQSWWLHTFGSNQFTVWHPTGSPRLYSAKSSAAVVDHAFADGVTTDNGQPFTWTWRGPWQSPSFYRRRLFPTTYFRKRLRQIRIGGHGLVDFYVAHDFAAGETLWSNDVFEWTTSPASMWAGTGTFGSDGLFGSVSNDQAIFFSLGVARAHSMVFTGSSDQPGDVTSYTFYVADRRDRQVG